MSPRLRYTNAHPFWRRLHRWLRDRIWPDALRKSHHVHIVRIGARKFKQVSFAHASEASRVESGLRSVEPIRRFPKFVFRREARVWVEFIEGRAPDPARSKDVEEILRFFADLYASARQVRLADTALESRLADDIEFLRAAALLPEATARDALQLAGQLKPDRVWLGFDYVDALTKNFLITPRGAVGIDIESLDGGQVLGMGLAKARARWLDLPDEDVSARIAELGAPHIGSQFGYVRLAFAASYAKQNVFRGKARRLHAAGLEKLLATLRPSSASLAIGSQATGSTKTRSAKIKTIRNP